MPLTAAARPRPRAARPATATLGQIAPLALLFYSFLLLPPEARLTFADVNLPAYRIFILVSLVFVPRLIARTKVRLGIADVLIGVSAAWMVVSFVGVYGSAGIVRALGLAVDFGGAYIIGRACIDSPLSLRRFIVIIAPGLLFAGIMMMIESISHVFIYRPLFADLFGQVNRYEGGEVIGLRSLQYQVRLGLTRAFGPFSHPILGGVFLALFLPLYFMGGIRSWPRWLGLAACAMAVFSVSSGAYLAFILGAVLLAADWMKRYIAFINWPAISTAVVAALLAVQALSEGGVIRLMARFTLDPSTAYFRILIWRFGGLSVEKHPLFGIGFESYERLRWMVPSIDAQFLLLAVRHGLVTAVALVVAILIVMVKLGQAAPRLPGKDRDLAVALNFVVAGAFISGFTVAYFGEAAAWFPAIIGMAASLADHALAPASAVPPAMRRPGLSRRPARGPARQQPPAGPAPQPAG